MYICIYVHNTPNTNKLSLSLSLALYIYVYIYIYKARFYTIGKPVLMICLSSSGKNLKLR